LQVNIIEEINNSGKAVISREMFSRIDMHATLLRIPAHPLAKVKTLTQGLELGFDL